MGRSTTELRDPYQSYFAAIGEPDEGKTLLERTPLDRLRLTGVVLAARRTALLEDSGGRGHVVTIGTAVGTAGGRVIAIRQDHIVVEETFRSALGVVQKLAIELRLEGGERAAQPS